MVNIYHLSMKVKQAFTYLLLSSQAHIEGVGAFSYQSACFNKGSSSHYTHNGAVRIEAFGPKKGSSTSLQETRRGTELSRYKTRSAILQYTLKTKQKEYKLQDSKLQILQSVIQKLQSSNKNLLDKIKELQQERDGIHYQPQSDEIWPPEMEVEVIKKEFQSKEAEWENALNMAQVKYQKLRKRCQELAEEVSLKDADIAFYQERAEVDESEMVLLRKEVGEREEYVTSLEEERDELQKMLQEKDDMNTTEVSKTQNESNTDDTQEAVDGKLTQLQNQIDVLTEQNIKAKEQLLELGAKWKNRREEMEMLIMKEQDKIIALQEKLFIAESEIHLQQEKNEQLSKEFDALQNSTSLVSIEKEILAKQMSKESLEIATAAVRQAEEREKELKKKLKRSQTQLEKARDESDCFEDKISKLEAQINEIQKTAEKLEKTEELVEKLETQIEVVENTERLKWEKRLSDQENEYERRVQELESQIEDMACNNSVKQIVDLTVVKNDAREISILPISRPKRLRRLANRIKSLVKK